MMKLRWLYLLVWAALVSVALTGRAREVCLSGYSGFCSKGITDGAVVDFSGLSLDHDARTLTHAFPAFSQPDPLAEKYHPISPYIFCANNPINLIDPTGMTFTKNSEDHVNRLVHEVDRRINNNNKDIAKNMAKLSEEGITDKKAKSIIKEISKLNAQNRTYQEVKDEINVLRKSSQVYNVVLDKSINITGDALGVGEVINGCSGYDFDTGMFDVKIGDKSLYMLAHELKHAYQFETGELSTGKNKKGYPFYDKSDEIEAYERGKLFGGPDFYSLASAYNDLQDGPKSVANYEPYIGIYFICLIRLANQSRSAFRWLGMTFVSNRMDE